MKTVLKWIAQSLVMSMGFILADKIYCKVMNFIDRRMHSENHVLVEEPEE